MVPCSFPLVLVVLMFAFRYRTPYVVHKNYLTKSCILDYYNYLKFCLTQRNAVCGYWLCKLLFNFSKAKFQDRLNGN
jgi:hypothetical protein